MLGGYQVDFQYSDNLRSVMVSIFKAYLTIMIFPIAFIAFLAIKHVHIRAFLGMRLCTILIELLKAIKEKKSPIIVRDCASAGKIFRL